MTSPVVRVFRVDLDQPAPVVAGLDALLSPGERDAPVRIRVARAATRIVLGRELDADPGGLRITRTCARCGHATHGRPALADGTGAGAISFSLSHSGGAGVVAVTEGAVRLGVDVEEVRPRHDLAALAARVLNDDEHAHWLRLDGDDERLRAFLCAWTAREAYLKATGVGIATRLRDVPARVDGWHHCALELGADRVGALAIDRTGVDVTYGELPAFVTSSGGTAR